VSERKLIKTVISSKARNLIVLKIQALKISPYGRNDKKRDFRSGTTYNALNRLTEIHFQDSTQDITYTYGQGTCGKGRLTGMTDPGGAYIYT